MMRLLSFVLQIAVLAAVAIWLADRPGTARIVWHGTVIETSAAFLALAALLGAYALHLVLRFVHFLRHGPVHWSLRRKLNKMQAGQDQLVRGLSALAAGNASEAGRLAVAARKNLGTAPAAQWLQAQAAQLAGDRRAAGEIFRALTADEATAALGYRGLIVEARRAGRWDEVDRLVGELSRVKPATPWLSLVRVESAARRGQWAEAEDALSHAAAARLLESPQGKQARAALRIAAAREAAALGDEAGALRAAEQAVQQTPDWTPAVLALADALAKTGHNRAARRVVERAWKAAPHPQLAQIVRRLASDPLDAYRGVEHLCRDKTEAPESHIALAEAALAAEIWGEARRHLTALVESGEATQKTYRLLAQVERRDRHDDRAAAAWLVKASEAPPPSAWLCTACGGTVEAWQPSCPHCGSFNTIDWRKPGQSRPCVPAALGFLGEDHA